MLRRTYLRLVMYSKTWTVARTGTWNVYTNAFTENESMTASADAFIIGTW